MTGLVFKIQANMDPNHRDRIAFMRVCSGKLQRGMRAKLVRTGKPSRLTVSAAILLRPGPLAGGGGLPGDVVGIPNHGLLRIGDALPLRGRGDRVSRRAELCSGNFARVWFADAMKAEEGCARALQQDGGRRRGAGVPAP